MSLMEIIFNAHILCGTLNLLVDSLAIEGSVELDIESMLFVLSLFKRVLL
jgi:hypothetical protein